MYMYMSRDIFPSPLFQFCKKWNKRGVLRFLLVQNWSKGGGGGAKKEEKGLIIGGGGGAQKKKFN